MADENRTVRCQVCGKEFGLGETVPVRLLSDPVVEVLRRSVPQLSPDGHICHDDLNKTRSRHVQELFTAERGELTDIEKEIVKSIAEQELMARNVNVEFEERLSVGARLADRVAVFGGSWKFISIFAAVLLTWIVINSALLIWRPFDPYPFILLNLVLSCLAAIQAPVIMMSQNRQEAKDRLRAGHDYQVNLKAELEIRALHEKMDHLIFKQWQRLLEIQQIQLDVMDDIARLARETGPPKDA